MDFMYVRATSRGSVLNSLTVPQPRLKERIDRSNQAREQIRMFRVLDADYYPRESHLVTFRDPWSFPILYHPACNNLVREHLETIANKVRPLGASRSKADNLAS